METVIPKIIRKTSPYLRRPKADVTRMMRDVTIALLPVTIFAVYKLITLISLVEGKKCKQWVTKDLLFGGTKNVACKEWE